MYLLAFTASLEESCRNKSGHYCLTTTCEPRGLLVLWLVFPSCSVFFFLSGEVDPSPQRGVGELKPSSNLQSTAQEAWDITLQSWDSLAAGVEESSGVKWSVKPHMVIYPSNLRI